MDKKHIINLQGREFVTYEGLLDQAHKDGLTSIRTTLVQIPSAANDFTCITTAEVTFTDKKGLVKTFTGIGDASPKNVSRGIVPHIIRMSETRSKARALRDGTNIGMTAYEELDTAELAPEEGQPGSRPATRTGQASVAAKPATKAQIDKMGAEMKRTGTSPENGREYLREHYGKISRSELSGDEAEDFLAYLGGLPAFDQGEA